MTAETINPVFGLAEEISSFLPLFFGGAADGGHVHFPGSGSCIVNSRVIAAMKIGVCLRIKMLGKKPAAITQSHGEEVGRLGAVTRPTLEPRLQISLERQRDRAQQRTDQ